MLVCSKFLYIVTKVLLQIYNFLRYQTPLNGIARKLMMKFNRNTIKTINLTLIHFKGLSYHSISNWDFMIISQNLAFPLGFLILQFYKLIIHHSWKPYKIRSLLSFFYILIKKSFFIFNTSYWFKSLDFLSLFLTSLYIVYSYSVQDLTKTAQKLWILLHWQLFPSYFLSFDSMPNFPCYWTV